MEKKKNESALTFLSTILRKSLELPEEIVVLTSSVKAIAEEVKQLADAVAMIAMTLQRHNDAISDLYDSQEFIVTQLRSSKSTDEVLARKVKEQKPN